MFHRPSLKPDDASPDGTPMTMRSEPSWPLTRRMGSGISASEDGDEIFDGGASFPNARPSVAALRIPRLTSRAHEVAGGENSDRKSLFISPVPSPLPGDAASSSSQYVATLKKRNAELTDQIRRMREGHVRTVVQMKNELMLHKLDPAHQVQLVDFFVDPDGEAFSMQNELHELRIGLTETTHELQSLKSEQKAALNEARLQHEKEVSLLKLEVERLRTESGGHQADKVLEALRKEDAHLKLEESKEKAAAIQEQARALEEELRQSKSRVENAESDLNFYKERAMERTLLLAKTLRLLKVGVKELGFDDMRSFEAWAAHMLEEETGSSWGEMRAALAASRRKAEQQLEVERLEARGAGAREGRAAPRAPEGQRAAPEWRGEPAEQQDGDGGGPHGGGHAGGDEDQPPMCAALSCDAVRETRLRGDVSQVNLDRLNQALADGATLSKRAIWLDAEGRSAGSRRTSGAAPPVRAPIRRLHQLGADVCPLCRQPKRHRRSSVLSLASEGTYLAKKEPRHGSARSLLAFLKDSAAAEHADEALSRGKRKLEGVTVVRREVLPPLPPFTEGFLPTSRPKRRGNHTAR